MNYVKLRERKRANGRVYFFLDISVNGHRRQEATGIYYIPGENKRVMKHKAEEQRIQRERDLQSGYFGTSKLDIDLIKYFEEHNKVNGFDLSKDPYDCSLKKLKEFVSLRPVKTTFDRLEYNTKFFQEFADFLLDTMKSPNSAWTYFTRLKVILNNAVRERIILQSPAKNVKIKKREVEKTYLTIDELKILTNTKCRYEIIKLGFLFSCFTGLRLSDIKKLQWKDIKKDSNNITTLHFRQKKTGGVEYFPLNQTAIDLINATKQSSNIYPLPGNFIFPLPYISKIERALNSWVKKSKINKHITFHCGRHTLQLILYQVEWIYLQSQNYSDIET